MHVVATCQCLMMTVMKRKLAVDRPLCCTGDYPPLLRDPLQHQHCVSRDALPSLHPGNSLNTPWCGYANSASVVVDACSHPSSSSLSCFVEQKPFQINLYQSTGSVHHSCSQTTSSCAKTPMLLPKLLAIIVLHQTTARHNPVIVSSRSTLDRFSFDS